MLLLVWAALTPSGLQSDLEWAARGTLSLLLPNHPHFCFRELVPSAAGVQVAREYPIPHHTLPTTTPCTAVDALGPVDRTLTAPEIRGLHPPAAAAGALRILWLRGRGPALDDIVREPGVCTYDRVLVEDQYVTVRLQEANPGCPLLAFDPHWTATRTLASLPWAPGQPLPYIDTALVSFHAYRVYDKEAETNSQWWLQDVDAWIPTLTGLVQGGFLKICDKPEDCQEDTAPFRLLFWDDVSTELIECLATGITPIYFGTASIEHYVARNVLFLENSFQTPGELQQLVMKMSSPDGVLNHGTRVYMLHESNHHLGMEGTSLSMAEFAANSRIEHEDIDCSIGTLAPSTTSTASPEFGSWVWEGYLFVRDYQPTTSTETYSLGTKARAAAVFLGSVTSSLSMSYSSPKHTALYDEPGEDSSWDMRWQRAMQTVNDRENKAYFRLKLDRRLYKYADETDGISKGEAIDMRRVVDVRDSGVPDDGAFYITWEKEEEGDTVKEIIEFRTVEHGMEGANERARWVYALQTAMVAAKANDPERPAAKSKPTVRQRIHKDVPSPGSKELLTVVRQDPAQQRVPEVISTLLEKVPREPLSLHDYRFNVQQTPQEGAAAGADTALAVSITEPAPLPVADSNCCCRRLPFFAKRDRQMSRFPLMRSEISNDGRL